METPGRRFMILSSAALRSPSAVNSTGGRPVSCSTLTLRRYLKNLKIMEYLPIFKNIITVYSWYFMWSSLFYNFLNLCFVLRYHVLYIIQILLSNLYCNNFATSIILQSITFSFCILFMFYGAQTYKLVRK